MSIDAPDWSTIPAPQDDGAVRHLAGAKLPLILLATTDGSTVDLLNLRGRTVVYAYPVLVARVSRALVTGTRSLVRGALCHNQARSTITFAQLKSLCVDQLFGLSTQGTVYQCEAAKRLHLPKGCFSFAYRGKKARIGQAPGKTGIFCHSGS